MQVTQEQFAQVIADARIAVQTPGTKARIKRKVERAAKRMSAEGETVNVNAPTWAALLLLAEGASAGAEQPQTVEPTPMPQEAQDAIDKYSDNLLTKGPADLVGFPQFPYSNPVSKTEGTYTVLGCTASGKTIKAWNGTKVVDINAEYFVQKYMG